MQKGCKKGICINALKAFEKNAVDYLMKPFSKDRFAKAIDRVKSRHATQPSNEQNIQQLAENLTAESKICRIVVKSPKAMVVIPVDDILYLEAQDDYVMIHTSDSRHMKKQTMKYFEDRLNPEQFVRIHRSFIANVSQITKLEPYAKDSFIAVLKNGVKLNVSSTGYKSLKSKLSF